MKSLLFTWKWLRSLPFKSVLGKIVNLFVLSEKLQIFFVITFYTLLRTKDLVEIVYQKKKNRLWLKFQYPKSYGANNLDDQ